MLQAADARRSRPRATSRAVAMPAAPPTHRAQPPVPCCDRRSHGLHVASAEALDGAFTAFLPHSPRATRLAPMGWPRRPCRSPPTASPPYRAHAHRHTEPPSRGRVGACSPRRTHLYKGQELAGHARGAVAQSRAAPPWLSTPSSCAHSISQPSAPLGNFARTYWSSPSHTLPGANRRLAGARPPAATAARSPPRRSPVTCPPQNRTQASPSRPLAPSQTFPRSRPPARLPDFGQTRRPLVPGTALQSHKNFQGCLCKPGVYL
jgi:hypothetical protein